jgi:predicted exporter
VCKARVLCALCPSAFNFPVFPALLLLRGSVFFSVYGYQHAASAIHIFGIRGITGPLICAALAVAAGLRVLAGHKAGFVEL